MKRCMLDLETLGTEPGCVVLSIGAVMFDENAGVGEHFYVEVNQKSCLEAGLKEDPRTVEWWGRQSAEARALLTRTAEGGTSLHEALHHFGMYLARAVALHVSNDGRARLPDTWRNVPELWGNGADFDGPILSAAYAAAGINRPWGHFTGRCYRTLKALYPDVPVKRTGVHHNALHDAQTQARHAITLLRLMRREESQPLWAKVLGLWGLR